MAKAKKVVTPKTKPFPVKNPFELKGKRYEKGDTVNLWNEAAIAYMQKEKFI